MEPDHCSVPTVVWTETPVEKLSKVLKYKGGLYLYNNEGANYARYCLMSKPDQIERHALAIKAARHLVTCPAPRESLVRLYSGRQVFGRPGHLDERWRREHWHLPQTAEEKAWHEQVRQRAKKEGIRQIGPYMEQAREIDFMIKRMDTQRW